MRLSPLLSKKRRRRLPSSSLSTQPLAFPAPLTSSTLQLSCLSAAGVVQLTPSWRGLKLNICAAVGAAVAEDVNAASKRPLVNQLLVIPGSFRAGFPVETDLLIFGTSGDGSSTQTARYYI